MAEEIKTEAVGKKASVVTRVVAPVKRRWRKTERYFTDAIWRVDVDAYPRGRRFFLQLQRFGLVVVRGFTEHRLGLHAAGLTIYSLLSIVPILMMMLLLTKPCGMYGWAREKLRAKRSMAVFMPAPPYIRPLSPMDLATRSEIRMRIMPITFWNRPMAVA